ncbi:Thiol-disulfide isomerase or thioredoxin [Pedobacter sp. ok626]|uniref:TlpA family protein disulfide reductase n=1 Tax=Pedobacter sp. ok626 TaxID=1761882 RepID=UPI00088BC21C|nr:TlpA disulfide reductase family protein [Pedobacter sp. ok626]SDK66419.1 Thiol-disulfide isomerase or thioredoxin [Pedobacter sp. ok626]
MRKICLIIFFALLSIFTYGQDGKKRLNLNPALPIAGKQISLQYNAKGTDLEFSDEVSGMATLFHKAAAEWEVQPVKLKKVNGNWTANLTPPADVSFIAFRFFQGSAERPEAADNNEGKGFYSQVLGAKNRPVPGNYLGEALLFIGSQELKPFATVEKDGARVAALLKKEAQISGAVLNEDQLSEIQRYYQFTIKDSQQAEALKSEILNRFPKGNTARFISFQKAQQEKDPAKFASAMEQFLVSFPIAEWRKNKGSQAYIYYTVYRALGTAYFERKAYDKFLALFNDFDFKTANEVYRWNLTRTEMMGSEEEKKALLPLSRKIMPYLLKLKNDGSYREDFGGNDSLENNNVDQQLSDRIFTHVSLCKAGGAYQEAVDYIQQLSKQKKYANAELNELHLYMLQKLGAVKDIQPLLEASVKNSAVTPLMFDKMKEIYLSAHKGDSAGYEKYLASLKSSDALSALRHHVMENMVRHPLIPFSLENAEGKMVNSADWKDKIVVIDFWATWCRPCIMAFPGMQLLIDKYANDPSVGVYMIGTMQFGDYKKKSVDYVKSKGFRFNLLHDAIGEKGEQNKVFKSLIPLFQSSGIPRKIIVKNGEVRYSSEGYSGSPSQLMDELSMAIEIIRSEN